MPKDELGVVRQYDFSHGPNYTQSIYGLEEKELAQSENLYWDGLLRSVPGSTRIIASAIAGTTHNVTGIFQYVKQNVTTKYLTIATDAGRIAWDNGGSWTTIQSGLNTNAKTFWDWVVFNDTLIMLSGRNPVKKWGGGAAAVANLGGSPPQSRFGTHHAVDYMFFAGHTSSPSQLRYNDTAASETWPIGNTLQIGRNDNEIITGLQRFGDTTAVFKKNSIYLVSGNTPNDFSINPTPSDVGCIAPNSIVLTDAGIFFWSEAGPALFNGFKTTLLGKRLKTILDEVDWTNPEKISASYYPSRKHILVSYPRVGQTYTDRILLLDLYRIDDERTPPVFWPITASGFSSAAPAFGTDGIRRIYMGHSSGHVSYFDSGSTFNGSTITTRMRTGALHLGKPDHIQNVRDITFRMKAQTGRASLRYAVDGNQTFTTYTGHPFSTAKSGYDVFQKMFEGNGTNAYITGNILQIDVTSIGATGFTMHGYEVASEVGSRREPI